MAHPRGLGALPSLEGCRELRRLLAQATISIDEVAMPTRIEQGTFIVLTMNLDQRLPDLPQKLHADADVVDKAPATAIGALHAAQDHAVLGGDAILGKEGEH